MPLFWLSAAFIIGLWLGSVLPWGWMAWAGAAAVLALAAFGERRLLARRNWYTTWRDFSRLPLVLVVAFIALGALRYAASRPVWGPANLAWYNDRGLYRLSAVIDQPPTRSGKTQTLVVAVDQLTPLVDGKPSGEPVAVSGLAQVVLIYGVDWQYGDRIEIDGAPLAPQIAGAEYYTDYLARRDIYTRLEYPQTHLVAHDQGNGFWATVYAIQDLAGRTFRQLLPQPEAALMAGVVLGGDNGLPEGVVQAFRDTGIAHIIAVSGFNVSIIAAIFFNWIFRRVRARGWAAIFSVLAIAAYSLIAGGSPSVVRAAVMSAAAMAGSLLGRRQVGIHTLALTAGIMTLFSPDLPWDVSFQLSFMATAGLVLYGDLLQQGFLRLAGRWLAAPLARRLAGSVGEYLLITLAAQLFTLPVTAVHFQRLSLSALLANPLVLPAQPLAMVLGGLALLLGMAFLPLGQLVAWLCWPLLAYTIRVAELLAQVQHTVMNIGQFNSILVILYYVILVVLAVAPLRQKLGAALKPAVGIVLAGLLAAGFWRSALAVPDGRLHLDVFNLPDGPALLLRSPGGQTWLVGGSSESAALADALGRRLPLLTDSMDGWITPSSAAAPLQGLDDLAQAYPPRRWIFPAKLNDSAAGRRLLVKVEALGARLITDGDPIEPLDLGQGAVLRVQAESGKGMALALEWQGFRALLPGGLTPAQLKAAWPDIRGINLLLLSPTDLQKAPIEAWSDDLRPQAVVYTGSDDPGQTNWTGLRAYEWISFLTDGKQMWVEGQHR